MKKKAFTLIEMVTAIAVLVIIISFASVIFKASIDSYRTANANTEIMQKLRAITGQLNKDFEGFCKDGYLYIRNEPKPSRDIYPNSSQQEQVRMDRIYFFTTGDFQSWSNPNVKSNIARVFWGHDSDSLDETSPPDVIPLSKCRLARDVCLIKPITPSSPDQIDDSNNISFAQCKADEADFDILEGDPNDAAGIMYVSVPTDFSIDPNNVRRLMCENIGEFRIEWTWGFTALGSLYWEPQRAMSELKPNHDKPKAIKFTFTLYDSKRILKEGRRFTHIVYLGD